jgi:hypothetical protein
LLDRKDLATAKGPPLGREITGEHSNFAEKRFCHSNFGPFLFCRTAFGTRRLLAPNANAYADNWCAACLSETEPNDIPRGDRDGMGQVIALGRRACARIAATRR